MRPISEPTLAILKSQNLTGQNKFNHQLRLEGTDYYSDVKETLTNTVKSESVWADYCIRADGKVLVAYLEGTGIYLSVIDSEEDMLSIADSAAGGTLFYTLGGINKVQCFSLLRLKNGKILFFINDIGHKANNIPHAIKVFESANGLGDDFTLKTTFSNYTRQSDLSDYMNALTSKAVQSDNGKIWLFAGGNAYIAYGYDLTSGVVWCSSDGGLTWTYKYQYIDYYFLHYFEVRSMVAIGNTIFCPVHYATSSSYTHLLISTDAGETWIKNGNNFPNLPAQDTNGDYKDLLDWHYGIDGWLYMIMGTLDAKASLYKSKPSVQVTYSYLDNMSNWTLVQSGISRYQWGSGFLSISPRGTLHYLHYSAVGINTRGMKDTGLFREIYSAPLLASSISISKGRGGANTASIQASNKGGTLNPKNPDSPLYGILGTNKQVIIKQGYGGELIETFTGLIDGFDMSTWPQTTNISLRDNLKKALDQTVTYGTQHTIHFELQAIENIVGYLCYLAGIETGEIEATGIQVAKTFSWESYADCFQFLGDLASFEWGCDEYGAFYFRRDYQPDDMYVAYTFEEGVDISALKYTIKDDDLYYKVAVFGKATDGSIISYEAPFLDAGTYNIMPQKILKIDATEATTTAELQKIAERAIALMQSRTAVVNFEAVAVPWLQVGDFIGVYESSTGAASIYRISSLKLDMDSDSFTMSIDSYYYGDSIVPGELPTDTATQTVAPSTNLIPEMTANTAPSGVARASSVYTSAYEPWQAFNSTDADLYWNAITNTGWIEYQYPEKMIVDKYSLKARQAIEYNDAMPKAWTFEGFDGAAWVVLDTRTVQTAWGISEVRTFLFANTVAYSKYRLNVSANNGYNRLQLEQLAMYYGGGS